MTKALLGDTKRNKRKKELEEQKEEKEGVDEDETSW